MRAKIVLIALLFSFASRADSLTAPTNGNSVVLPQSGSLLNTGDIVQLNISGAQWATARFVFATGTSQTLEFDTTSDGVNWIASGQGAPYVKRIDAVSANPSVVIGSTATIGGNSLTFNLSTYGASTWELVLAGNVQAVRVKALGTITSANLVTINYGLPYQLGVPVTSVLFDVTSQTNYALSTGIWDLSGWRSVSTYYQCGTGLQASGVYYDDSGATPASIWLSATSGYGWIIQSRDQAGYVNGALTSAYSAGVPNLPKRQLWATTNLVSVTSRLRIESSR